MSGQADQREGGARNVEAPRPAHPLASGPKHGHARSFFSTLQHREGELRLRESVADLVVLLTRSRSYVADPSSVDRRRAARRGGLLVLWGLRALILMGLPFFLLIRSALYLHLGREWPVWLALLVGAGLMTAILAGYAGWLTQRFTGSHRIPRIALGSLLLLVIGYAGFAVAYLSATNAKSEEVRAFYRSVHPLLRVAVGTVILADGDLVVTDTRRTQGDYAAMGLSPRRRSLHFVQPDGYVHAVDLRTAGRGEWRNSLLRGYFAVMGFPTLRHVGTWDHLHVSLQAEAQAAWASTSKARADSTALP